MLDVARGKPIDLLFLASNTFREIIVSSKRRTEKISEALNARPDVIGSAQWRDRRAPSGVGRVARINGLEILDISRPSR